VYCSTKKDLRKPGEISVIQPRRCEMCISEKLEEICKSNPSAEEAAKWYLTLTPEEQEKLRKYIQEIQAKLITAWEGFLG